MHEQPSGKPVAEWGESPREWVTVMPPERGYVRYAKVDFVSTAYTGR